MDLINEKKFENSIRKLIAICKCEDVCRKTIHVDGYYATFDFRLLNDVNLAKDTKVGLNEQGEKDGRN